ncbi:MAG: hypothetical protein EBT47_10815 [Chloroflexi bacterium]|nr:hypothetical protein [Chloroflexota bacterium]
MTDGAPQEVSADSGSDHDLCSMSVAQLRHAYVTGGLSPVDVTRAHLNRITRADPAYTTFVTVDADRAMASARQSETRIRTGQEVGALEGIPLSVKDLINVGRRRGRCQLETGWSRDTRHKHPPRVCVWGYECQRAHRNAEEPLGCVPDLRRLKWRIRSGGGGWLCCRCDGYRNRQLNPAPGCILRNCWLQTHIREGLPRWRRAPRVIA